jgi:hypothetical protein
MLLVFTSIYPNITEKVTAQNQKNQRRRIQFEVFAQTFIKRKNIIARAILGKFQFIGVYDWKNTSGKAAHRVGAMNIDGVREPVMRQGEWVFQVEFMIDN